MNLLNSHTTDPMKLILLPFILLISIISSTAFAFDNRLGLINTEQQEHCNTHSIPSLTKTLHSTSAQSIPLDCENTVKCCAQACYSQIQLYLHSLPDSAVVQYSYSLQYHYFSLVQGIMKPIERPPKT